jgi:hypothetical protein
MTSGAAGSDFGSANDKRLVHPDIGFWLTTQSSAVPIVRFQQSSRLFSRQKMNVHLTPEDRLSILRTEDQFRRWNSLDDERFCILCERKFNGRQIEVRSFANGKHELRCPTEGCDSGPHQWVYPGTPLISDIVDPNWWSASGKEPRTLSGLSSGAQFQRQEHA